MSDYEFILPLVVYIPLKTKPDIRFGVDVNTFKSMNRFNYNKAKAIYCEHMREQLEGFEMIRGQIAVHYTYYKNINNSPDLDNFVGGAKKFFQDAMVSHGLIEDDNVNFIPRNSESYGGHSPGNGRIVAKITVLN